MSDSYLFLHFEGVNKEKTLTLRAGVKFVVKIYVKSIIICYKNIVTIFFCNNTFSQ